jgi:hypothetical protein
MSTIEKANPTQEIASAFFGLVSAGKFEEAQKTFFSPDIVSSELADAEGNRKKSEGIDAISSNRENFQAIVESVEGLKTTAPVVYGNSFAFGFELDFTAKGGNKQLLSEICLYQVQDGKIVTEQFFN